VIDRSVVGTFLHAAMDFPSIESAAQSGIACADELNLFQHSLSGSCILATPMNTDLNESAGAVPTPSLTVAEPLGGINGQEIVRR